MEQGAIELVSDSFNYENVVLNRKKLPEELNKGPVTKRRCTDYFFCLFSVAFVAGFIYMMHNLKQGTEGQLKALSSPLST
jgi:hypothetical protein